MKNTFLTAFTVAIAVVALVGCSGKPKGFPSVKKCEITVVDGGAGVEGVEIALIPASPISGVIVGGKTDSTGKCVVQTTFANFSAPGAPAGEFGVTLRKDPVPSTPELTVEQMGEMSRGEIDDYNAERQAEIDGMEKIVPADLTSVQTTPIKVNVPADSAVTVDLAQYK